ncbi:hypothetical protein RRF57_002817 [Xylaria bambusicola]|uniref:Uncharacterized protein n=1 Tax=Xylaria bambusicola TaxID=326684 RepID=A0AAN7UFT2_9PEZI
MIGDTDLAYAISNLKASQAGFKSHSGKEVMHRDFGFKKVLPNTDDSEHAPVLSYSGAQNGRGLTRP